MWEKALEPFGICYRWRAAMVVRLADLADRPVLPDGYTLAPFDPARLDQIAVVDWQAYRGTVDAALYWRYFRSPLGTRRLWDEALRGRFGAFDPERTRLLLHEDRLCGDVLCAVRTRREGFIGNLAVLPEHRGGLGRALLLSALWAHREAGFEHVSLAVTLANERALHLYTTLGFRVRNRFPVATRPGVEVLRALAHAQPVSGDARSVTR
jgi:ribosomal protein S18 acetylase RimI-like enzyme